MKRFLLLGLLVWSGENVASAHGSEFLGAKLRVLPTRQLLLEMTADFGENPMVASRDEALEALNHNLTLELGGKPVPIHELAPLTFVDRSQPDTSSPLPTDQSGKPHELLAGIWAWTPPEDVQAVKFRVPDSVNHSTIFWLDEDGVAKEKKKWSMLVGGDSTPPIPLPPVQHSWLWAWIVVIICVALAFVFVHRLRSPRTA